MRRLALLLLVITGLGVLQNAPRADEIDDSLRKADLRPEEISRKPGGKSWGDTFLSFFGSLFTTKPFGRSVALVIGVSRYESGWPQLDATCDDPARMRQLLIDQEGYDLVV